ncbi:MAG: type II toxin-antitoxin system HicA family toxin [Chloroflexi bacterium]|nr:type II toxin-antitoxin system HicA family toxin [Chloroflexota bacterium]MBI3733462.1 type II toxin-antitoxin system HicA family toxin [Chloroflexota bacterium]
MSRLPVISGRMLVKILERLNFAFIRQRGSHIIVRRTTPPHVTVAIPDHKELRAGTLRGILRDVGMKVDDLNDHLSNL